MTFRERFNGMIAELEADSRVLIQRAHVAPPASDAAIGRAQRVFGRELPDDIVAFYREMNGMSLRWVFADAADQADRKRATGPFTKIDDSTQTPGLIHFMPVEEVFVGCDVYEGHIWFEDADGEPMKIGKKKYSYTELTRGLRPFDHYRDLNMAALFVGAKDASVPVMLGDNHGADWSQSGTGIFADYVDAVLALRGSVRARSTFMLSPLSEALGWSFAVSQWQRTPPTLDQVLAWSRMSEGEDEDNDERWFGEVQPMLASASEPKAKRLLRELGA